MEKETEDTGGAGNVEAPATPQVTAPTIVCVRERENVSKKKKTWDDCDNPN
jgi:hypothetical protein